MQKPFESFVTHNPETSYELFQSYRSTGKSLLLGSELWDGFQAFAADRPTVQRDRAIADVILKSQEAAFSEHDFYLMVRPDVARWLYYRFNFESKTLTQVTAGEFLAFKEQHISSSPNARILEIDFSPFVRDFPKMNQTRSIGNGVEFLNRHFSSRLAHDLTRGEGLLLSFLSVHGYDSQPFMINSSLSSVRELRQALVHGMKYLERQPADHQWPEFENSLRAMGFEPGWGRTRDGIVKTMSLLADLLEAPDYQILETFLARIPMIFNIAILSPHGYFGQTGVLGLPDTGGQVVYILDQVKALEKEMKLRLFNQGLEIKPRILIVTRLIPECGTTTCNEKEEAVNGTDGVSIIRIPFRREDGSIIDHWISRFEVWPYLERFSIEAEQTILERLGRRPDLVIGNYSDGNLAAYLIAQSLGVTQCTIAHALEKTKYLYSALYWKDLEDQYHFSCQFTADLIAMNSSDFIIASTYQEIAGSEDVVGQYESYASFTMPDLQRVLHGVDVFDPKFNIVSPGADADIYFPFSDSQRRFTDEQDRIRELLYGEPGDFYRGSFNNAEKPLIFSMARLDQIKNLTGLVRWFGEHGSLRHQANLLIIGGTIAEEQSGDNEERQQIRLMHELFDQLDLEGHARWLGTRLAKKTSGELYRCIADGRGVFVQPAFFEAFGLTVIEAMASGLPTFATRYGGPLEIIKHGISGFHLDPNYGEQAADAISDFFTRCSDHPDHWGQIAHGAIQRVEACYTWRRYAKRLLSLTCIYGFWKYTTNLERQETRRYMEMLYQLQFKHRAATIPHH